MLARPSFFDNGRYTECISSRRNNAISCKSHRACGESDRLLNYRCLATCCLIIALTPSRNTGSFSFFFLFTSIYEMVIHLGVVAVRLRCVASFRERFCDFPRHINACKSRRVNVDDTNERPVKAGMAGNSFHSLCKSSRTCVCLRGNVSGCSVLFTN